MSLGAAAIYGISTQPTEYQAEAQQRLHLSFPLLSDRHLHLTQALELPIHKVSPRPVRLSRPQAHWKFHSHVAGMLSRDCTFHSFCSALATSI